jgi:hypothetical protein
MPRSDPKDHSYLRLVRGVSAVSAGRPRTPGGPNPEALLQGALPTVFLISPARTSGERAAMLVRSRAALGSRLRDGGAALGDVFAWLSALYFRGKLTYARAFGTALVMTPGAGLRAPETLITADELRAMGTIDIASDDFARPLRRDAAFVDHAYGRDAVVVLLGSIATGKYIDTLLAAFGARLVFPSAFVGRGDMSRGGLLLRAARSGEPLAYEPIQGATLHGPRPPRLPRIRR